MDFRFRPPVLADAELLLTWRRRPDITRYMFTDLNHEDLGQQRAWIESMAERDDCRHFLVLDGERPIGYLSYREIDRLNSRCSSGCYIAETADRKKISNAFHAHLMDYGFYGLGLHKIIAYHLGGNARIIKIQHLLGMRFVGVFQGHIVKAGIRHDVYIFEQTLQEWELTNRPLTPSVTLAAFEH